MQPVSQGGQFCSFLIIFPFWNSISKALETLKGHLDACFSCSWSPCGNLLATGSQDGTCHIFDVRKFGSFHSYHKYHTRRLNTSSLHILPAVLAPIQSVKFSPDGCILAVAEADDYVHIFNVKNDFNTSQTIDFFGT